MEVIKFGMAEDHLPPPVSDTDMHLLKYVWLFHCKHYNVHISLKETIEVLQTNISSLTDRVGRFRDCFLE